MRSRPSGWRRQWTSAGRRRLTPHGCAAPAHLRLREFLGRAITGAGTVADRLYDRPGAAAFAGVARAEFTDDIWQELPRGEGTPAITIPVLMPGIAYTETPVLVADDIIAIEPISGRWASLADLHNGMLGTVPSDSSVSVRLCGKPLNWLAADGSTAAGLGAWPPAICILDSGADAVEELLLERALILDDREHADEIDRRRQAIRNRIIARMPAGGDLYIAGA